MVLSIQLNTICVSVRPIMAPLAGRTEIREDLKLQWSLRKPLELPLSFCQDRVLSVIFPWPEKVHAGKRFCWVDSQQSAAAVSQLWPLFCWTTIFLSVLEDKSLWQRNFRRALISWSVADLQIWADRINFRAECPAAISYPCRSFNWSHGCIGCISLLA